jgi:hypothetical protein
MQTQALLKPHRVSVKQSDFAPSERTTLRKAKGRTVVVLTAQAEEDAKCVLDKGYFEEMLREMRSLEETLEIMADKKLYQRLMRSSKTLKQDARAGRLHSMEEVLREV